jgi:hypothetical protein
MWEQMKKKTSPVELQPDPGRLQWLALASDTAADARSFLFNLDLTSAAAFLPSRTDNHEG